MKRILEIAKEEIDENLKKIGEHRKVGVQLPASLDNHAYEILKYIEKKTGCEIYMLADPSYGSCDLRDFQLEKIGIDLLIHFGHIAYISPQDNVLYIPLKFEVGDEFIEEIKRYISSRAREYCKLGISANTQFFYGLDGIKEHQDLLFCKEPVLGCRYRSAMEIADKVDTFLYIGDGKFHPLGLRIATDKKVAIADPWTEKIIDPDEVELEARKFLTMRFANIYRAMDSEKFGIVISTKSGQFNPAIAKKVKDDLDSAGRRSCYIVMDYVDPRLRYHDIDCFVITACPRIAIEDSELYKKPIINPSELEIAMGYRKTYKLEER